MDWIALRKQGKEVFGKYKYVLLVLVLGMTLMAIPDRSGETEISVPDEPVAQTLSLPQELAHILAQIEGVGKVEVMVTQSRGPETVYQTNEDSSGGSGSQSVRVETVIIQNPDRGECALVRRTDPPAYLGAVVVCQGADRPAVQLQVIEAVAAVTGIGTDRIRVLKMK